MDTHSNHNNCLEEIIKAITKWKDAGKDNQETSDIAKSLGYKTMDLIAQNLDFITSCLDKYDVSFETKTIFHRFNEEIKDIERTNPADRNFIGDYLHYQWFTQPEITEDLKNLMKEQGQGKEQLWDKGNPDYMGTEEAVKEAKRKGRKISTPTLGRKLKPNGLIRYMRKYTDETHTKYTRTRVHIGEFKASLDTLPFLRDEFSEKAFNERQSEITTEKKNKGQFPDKDSGYTNLTRKIFTKEP